MSKTIYYSIKFLSDWHCGSGLSSGADLDLLVIKDKNKLPFIPGKTIKGLLREAVEEINGFEKKLDEASMTKAFGKSSDANDINQGCCFFTNACLEKGMQEAIKKDKLQEFLYRKLAATAINEEGVAEKHSLRKMEVCVPSTLEGKILEVPDNMVDLLMKGMKFIKRLGVNRNRGLGRCIITLTNIEQEKGYGQ